MFLSGQQRPVSRPSDMRYLLRFERPLRSSRCGHPDPTVSDDRVQLAVRARVMSPNNADQVSWTNKQITPGWLKMREQSFVLSSNLHLETISFRLTRVTIIVVHSTGLKTRRAEHTAPKDLPLV
jgi:hypothetical protein